MTQASWLTAGKLHRGSAADLWERMDEALTPLFAPSRAVFPRPYEPAGEDAAVAAFDDIVMTDRISELVATPEQLGLARAYCTLQFNGPANEGAYTQLLRWVALAGGNWRLLSEALGGYELVAGTSALIDAMHKEGGFPVRFGARVTSIDCGHGGVEIALADGGVVEAQAVIVAVPINVLGQIRFQPGLPPGIASVARAGQVSRGAKIWVRAKGHVEDWCAFAEDHPIVFAYTDSSDDDDSILVCFARDGDELPGEGHAAVQAALQALLPDVLVLDCATHNWRQDPLTRQTWGMLRPGQLTQLRDLERLAGPVFIAGSDFASGWAGLMEGAIESGMTAARSAVSYLARARRAEPKL